MATRSGWVIAKSRATRQPRECAMSVAPEEELMLAWAKIPARSDAKEEIESVERALVGLSPWPSRSKRWKEEDWVIDAGRDEISGEKYSAVPPRPWTNTIGLSEGLPWEV